MVARHDTSRQQRRELPVKPSHRQVGFEHEDSCSSCRRRRRSTSGRRMVSNKYSCIYTISDWSLEPLASRTIQPPSRC